MPDSAGIVTSRPPVLENRIDDAKLFPQRSCPRAATLSAAALRPMIRYIDDTTNEKSPVAIILVGTALVAPASSNK
jgi:hypothetical protein